jgi:hypothetical protein
MNINILTFNNKVGILTDAMLLQTLFKKNNINSTVSFLENKESIQSSDIGIWIQNVCTDMMDKFKINIYYINEEWYHSPNSCLSMFDYVICKSQYAKDTFFKDISNVIYIPFFSQDFYDESVIRKNKYLHFKGKSIQKNTEVLLKLKVPFTLHDPNNIYKTNTNNITHINSYISKSNVKQLLNEHKTHICCSLYESWGHYVYEGLSTGAEIICSDLPQFKENLDPDLVHFIPTTKSVIDTYQYCNENKNNLYNIREAFFVNENYLYDKLTNFVPKNKETLRRKLFRHINKNSKEKLMNFIHNI